jgi:hypothetical protein
MEAVIISVVSIILGILVGGGMRKKCCGGVHFAKLMYWLCAISISHELLGLWHNKSVFFNFCSKKRELPFVVKKEQVVVKRLQILLLENLC